MSDRTGSKRHRVTIQRLVEPPPQDPFGDPIETWEEYAERWAFVKPLEERELFQAQQTQTFSDTSIMLDYDPLTAMVTTKDRVWHPAKEQTFDITAVINVDTGNKELRLLGRVRS